MTPVARRTARRAVDRVLSAAGLEVRRVQADHHYVPDIYGKTARKQVDVREFTPFGELARVAIGHGKTLLYFDRLYTIFQGLEAMAHRLQPGLSAAEVGVYQGGTSHFIASSLRALGYAPTRVHSFDTFMGHAPQDLDGAVDPHHSRAAPTAFKNTAADSVREFLAEFPECVVHVGRFQDQCESVESEIFGFVHLDVDIFEPTRFALDWFSNRMPAGGMIVVDDYGVRTCPGVKQAVDDFVSSDERFRRLHLLSGQAVVVRVAPT